MEPDDVTPPVHQRLRDAFASEAAAAAEAEELIAATFEQLAEGHPDQADHLHDQAVIAAELAKAERARARQFGDDPATGEDR